VFRAFPISGGFSLADLSLSERKDKINGNRKNFYLFWNIEKYFLIWYSGNKDNS
jgi:hypothetical protein